MVPRGGEARNQLTRIATRICEREREEYARERRVASRELFFQQLELSLAESCLPRYRSDNAGIQAIIIVLSPRRIFDLVKFEFVTLIEDLFDSPIIEVNVDEDKDKFNFFSSFQVHTLIRNAIESTEDSDRQKKQNSFSEKQIFFLLKIFF